MGRHLGASPGPYRVLRLLGQDRELILGHGAALAGAAHAPDDLVPGKGLRGAATLGHHQDHRLLCGEPPATLRARPATADRGAFVGCPAVDDAAVLMPAKRAEHAITSPVGLPRAGFLLHNLWRNYSCVTTRCCVQLSSDRRLTQAAAAVSSAAHAPPVAKLLVASPGARARSACRLSRAAPTGADLARCWCHGAR